MKHLGFVAFLLLMSIFSFAQQRAVTDQGEQVVLYNDGTWVYVEKDSIRRDEVAINQLPFSKSKKASFLLKSKRIDIGCWIDPKVWKFRTSQSHEAAEFEIDHVDGSMYALIITEKLDVPTESLGNLAIQNALAAAPDLKVTTKEYRNVNGIKVLMMRMTGTIEDMRFSYFGYYYAADGGATQFLAYASEEFMEENLTEVEDLLNGFVTLRK
jgi:hypothetical protein